MKKSGFLKLNWADVLKGFLLALIAFVISYLQETFIPSLDISPELKIIIITVLGYLTKNFFEGAKKDE